MKFCGRLKKYTPHLLMTLNFLSLAIFIVLLQSLISGGSVSVLVFVFYEHLVSTILLSTLAFLIERGKRPSLTLKAFFSACLLGFLHQTCIYKTLVVTWVCLFEIKKGECPCFLCASCLSTLAFLFETGNNRAPITLNAFC